MDSTSPPKRALPARTLLWTMAALACVAAGLPFWVIRPFTAQDPGQLQIALWFVRWAPAITGVAAVMGVLSAILVWRSTKRGQWGARLVSYVALALLAVAAVVARVNVYEKMFHSIKSPAFVSRTDAKLDDNDMVLVVRNGRESRGYPVRAMTFHHIVNDVLAGQPIAVTYCSLCHTGIVWSRLVDGRVLTLHIGGINNQNMLMRDDETGSFWQQSTGIAVAGPLAGTSLTMLSFDELTTSAWAAESPAGTVLAEVASDASDYASKDWEERMAKRPSVLAKEGPLEPRDLVLGLRVAGEDAAFPLTKVLAQATLADTIANTPIVFLVGPDHHSVRAFEARLDGHAVELFGKPNAPGTWLDASGTEWTFEGCTQDGSHCLHPISIFRSYWFDWHGHHPKGTLAQN